ncbi:HalOD1 output domain-containing protein [Halorientalis brevis]|uniref:HalOD1 output domain-containing protein n=1 Tax=Halorientalis brevis TaxID=1126241 RepID=A0ABD6CBY5_9EURY|nr:HalOD1 output domain-containing protein [Halorientalis brevis]
MVRDVDSGEALSSRVVRSVAAREGIGPASLSPRLFDVIDPDALDSLFTTTDGHVTFPYCGYTVTVYADGQVTVDETA